MLLVHQAEFLRSTLLTCLSQTSSDCKSQKFIKTSQCRKGDFLESEWSWATRPTFGTKVVVLSVILLAVQLFNSVSVDQLYLCFLLHMVGNGCLAPNSRRENIIDPLWVRCLPLGQSAVWCQPMGRCSEGAQGVLFLGLN